MRALEARGILVSNGGGGCALNCGCGCDCGGGGGGGRDEDEDDDGEGNCDVCGGDKCVAKWLLSWLVCL